MSAALRAVVVVVVTLAVAITVAWPLGTRAVTLAGAPAPLVLALVAIGINLIAFVPAALLHTERFYDLVGALTYGSVIALAGFAALHDNGTLTTAQLVLLTLPTVWAVRLGSFLFRRVLTRGKDGRFDEMKHEPARFLIAWTVQGLWVFLTLLAVIVLVTRRAASPSLDPAFVVGVSLWALGFSIEVAADRQKAAFQRDPANAGRFITTGLWSYARHPNYFGEIVLWLGLFVVGVPTYVGAEWLAALSPLFVFSLLRFVSGVPLLEERARARWGEDPAWQRYMARTPRLVPWPLRRRDDATA